MKLFASGNIPALPSGLSIAVYKHDGTDTPSTLAAITDRAGSAIAQPGFVTDANGWFEFSGADALYDIKLGGGAGAPDTSWNGGAAKWIRGQALVSPGGGYKNKIINGCMRVAQRGTVFNGVGAGVYTLDRWRVSHDATSVNVEQQTSSVLNEGNLLRLTLVTAGSYTDFSVIQALETVDCRRLAGADVVLSVKLRRNAAFNTGQARINIYSGTGTDEAAVSTGRVNDELVIPYSSLDTVNFTTFSLPATLGSDRTQVGVVIRFDSGAPSGSFLDIAEVQLEKATIATDFEQRHIAQELALCQRYCFSGSIYVDVYAGRKSFLYPSTMRVVPAITGGGTGFTSGGVCTTLNCYVWQDTASLQTLIFDAEL